MDRSRRPRRTHAMATRSRSKSVARPSASARAPRRERYRAQRGRRRRNARRAEEPEAKEEDVAFREQEIAFEPDAGEDVQQQEQDPEVAANENIMLQNAVERPEAEDNGDLNSECPASTVRLGHRICGTCPPRQESSEAAKAYFLSKSPYGPGKELENDLVYQSQQSEAHRGKAYLGAKSYIIDAVLYSMCHNDPEANPYHYSSLGLGYNGLDTGRRIGSIQASRRRASQAQADAGAQEVAEPPVQ